MTCNLLAWHCGYGYLRTMKDSHEFTGRQEEASGFANRKVAEKVIKSRGLNPRDFVFRYRQ